ERYDEIVVAHTVAHLQLQGRHLAGDRGRVGTNAHTAPAILGLVEVPLITDAEVASRHAVEATGAGDSGALHRLLPEVDSAKDLYTRHRCSLLGCCQPALMLLD